MERSLMMTGPVILEMMEGGKRCTHLAARLQPAEVVVGAVHQLQLVRRHAQCLVRRRVLPRDHLVCCVSS
jgi:hypothetical protein